MKNIRLWQKVRPVLEENGHKSLAINYCQKRVGVGGGFKLKQTILRGRFKEFYEKRPKEESLLVVGLLIVGLF
jgi:hypothetical protein